MKERVEEFLRYLREEEGYSVHTVDAYRNDLNQFIDFWTRKVAPEVPTWSSVTREGIIDYILFLKDRSYASSTVARKVAALKSFFHFMLKRGMVDDDPTATVDSPRVLKRLPKILSKEQIEKLLAEPGKSSGPKALRDKAILEVLYSTGMKVSEMTLLNLEDVDLTSGTVRVFYGKGRERIVPLSRDAVEALQEYLQKGRTYFLKANPHEKALFLNPKGERLTRQGLWIIIKRYAQAVGIKESISPNTLRHSFAAHKLREGVAVEDIKKLLGHSSPVTTRIYRRLILAEEQV